MFESTFVEENEDFELVSPEQTNQITSIAEANWQVRKVKENKADAEKFKDQAKEIMDSYKIKVEQWLTGKLEALSRDSEYRLTLLEEFYKNNPPSKGKTISVPEGNFGLRKKPEKFEYDEHVLDNILAHSNELQDFIVNEPKLNKAEIKKSARIQDGTVWLNNIPVPGITFVAAEDKFEVR